MNFHSVLNQRTYRNKHLRNGNEARDSGTYRRRNICIMPAVQSAGPPDTALARGLEVAHWSHWPATTCSDKTPFSDGATDVRANRRSSRSANSQPLPLRTNWYQFDHLAPNVMRRTKVLSRCKMAESAQGHRLPVMRYGDKLMFMWPQGEAHNQLQLNVHKDER